MTTQFSTKSINKEKNTKKKTQQGSKGNSSHTGWKENSVIPGFGLTLGITVAMLSILILIPLASILGYSFQLSFSEFWELLSRDTVRQAFAVSIGCALVAALINSVFGLILAWVLVRYEFPGRKLMDSMIELPFALPTAVAGITLTKLYSDQGAMGKLFGLFGIQVSYTRLGIIVAMIFVGIPFVVRSIEPVLQKLPRELEEAGTMLGASRSYTFRRVILPELFPSWIAGFGLSFARGVGEYGSVIYISGNSAKQGTQVISYVIMQKLNSGGADYQEAAALALVMLIISFAVMFVINVVQATAARKAK